jgi:catalase
MHAKGWGLSDTFTVTSDITRYTKAKSFPRSAKKTDGLRPLSTVAGERGGRRPSATSAGFAMKYDTEDGNWDLVGKISPVFFLRDPLKFPDLIMSSSATSAPICAAPRTTGFLEPCCRSACTSDDHG